MGRDQSACRRWQAKRNEKSPNVSEFGIEAPGKIQEEGAEGNDDVGETLRRRRVAVALLFKKAKLFSDPRPVARLLGASLAPLWIWGNLLLALLL